METLGERLKHARELKGLTQEELHELSGVSQQTIGHLEKRRSKKSGFTGELASALGVSLAWLQSGAGEIHGPLVSIEGSPTSQDISRLPKTIFLDIKETVDYQEIIKAHKSGAKRKGLELPVIVPCSNYSACFYTKAPDGSNAPFISKHDHVYIDTTLKPERGQMVLANSDIGPIFGRAGLRPGGRYQIETLDGSYAEEFDDPDFAHIIGVATWVGRRLI